MIALTKPPHYKCERCECFSLVDMIVEFQARNIINYEWDKDGFIIKQKLVRKVSAQMLKKLL